MSKAKRVGGGHCPLARRRSHNQSPVRTHPGSKSPINPFSLPPSPPPLPSSRFIATLRQQDRETPTMKEVNQPGCSSCLMGLFFVFYAHRPPPPPSSVSTRSRRDGSTWSRCDTGSRTSGNRSGRTPELKDFLREMWQLFYVYLKKHVQIPFRTILRIFYLHFRIFFNVLYSNAYVT